MRVCKDQDITPEPDRVLSLQETNAVVTRDAGLLQQQVTHLTAAGEKNLATF